MPQNKHKFFESFEFQQSAQEVLNTWTDGEETTNMENAVEEVNEIVRQTSLFFGLDLVSSSKLLQV